MFVTVDVEVIYKSVAATVKAVGKKQGLKDMSSPLCSVVYLQSLGFIACKLEPSIGNGTMQVLSLMQNRLQEA